MQRLSIDEVIAHCNRHTESMESHSGRSRLEETPVGNSDIMKQYWEHRQVAEWLEELKQYKEIGTVENFKALKEKSVPKKVKEIHCDEYYCPACGSENNCSDTHTVGDKFCPECGQAIKIEQNE